MDGRGRLFAAVLIAAAIAFPSTAAASVSYQQAAKLTAAGGAALDGFGYSVAASGSTIVVGAPSSNSSAVGAAYVIQEPAGGWSSGTPTVTKLTPSDGVAGEHFGISVAIAGSTVVVGTFKSGSGLVGAAYVYQKPTTGWPASMTETIKLTPPDATTRGFGFALGTDGTTIAVGARDSVNSTNQAVVYVYNQQSGAWVNTPTAELNGTTTATGGASVAVQGSTIVAGAETTNSEKGAAYVFQEGAGWTTGSDNNVATLTASDAASDELGASVAIDGSTIAAGAIGASPGGAVYVFQGSGSSWSQKARLTATDEPASVRFGYAIALSGTTLVVGAPTSDSNTGAIYVFTGSGANWTQTAELTASDSAKQDEFGFATALSGSTIFAGSPYTSVGANSYQGATYVLTPASAAPASTAAPVVSGTAQPGDALSCSTGSWSGSPTRYTYQWKRDGVAIAGATGKTYVVQIADEAQTLTCAVTATGTGGTSAPALSAGTFVGTKSELSCHKATGSLSGTKLGPLALGMTLAQAKHKLPISAKNVSGFTSFCLYAGFGIRVAFPSAKELRSLKSSERAKVKNRIVIALTANPGYKLKGVVPGEKIAKVEKKLHTEKPFHIGINYWYFCHDGAATGVLKVRNGIIYEIGIATKALSSGSYKSQFKFMNSFG